MYLAAHSLGCSILTVVDMDDPNFKLQDPGGWGSERVNVMREDGKGFGKLLRYLRGKDRAGILLWVDTSTTDDGDVGYFDYTDGVDSKTYVCSGNKFYKMLESRGYHVEKTVSYKNPGHEGRCTVYWWYFRKRPKSVASRGKTAVASKSSGGSSSRSSEANGRKKVAA